MTDSSDAESTSEEHPIVTRDWLEAVLRKYYNKNDIIVESYTLTQGESISDSILSDISKLHVEISQSSDPKEVTHLYLILKLLPLDPFSRCFAAEAQCDYREIKFYNQVAPDLKDFQEKNLNGNEIKLPIPKCLFAKHIPADINNPATTPTYIEESAILLENLTHEGFQEVNVVTGLSVEQAESALEAVSRIHALSLALKVKEKKPLHEHYNFLFRLEKYADSYKQLVERGIPVLMRFIADKEDMVAIQTKLDVLKTQARDLIIALLTPDEPMALITHTDFWCNNLLFRDKDCIILDWQMITYSKPTTDIALLLISSLSTETRRKYVGPLLDHYWKHFTEYSSRLGVQIEDDLGYTRARLAEDYRRSQLLALLLCIGSIDLAFENKNTEERIVDVLKDLNKDGVLTSDIVPTAQVTV